MCSLKNIAIFALAIVVRASAEEQAPDLAPSPGDVFQLAGLRGEGHHCQNLGELSSALLTLVEGMNQREERDGSAEEGHRALFDCGPYNPNVGYPMCSWCGWCRRRLRGGGEEEEDSFLLDTLPSPIEDTKNAEENGATAKLLPSVTHTCETSLQSLCKGAWCCLICGWSCDHEIEEENALALAWFEERGGEYELPGCLAGSTLTWTIVT